MRKRVQEGVTVCIRGRSSKGAGLLASLLALLTAFAAGCASAPPVAQANAPEPPRMLVFTRTGGYRHESIADAVRTLRALGAAEGLAVEHTEDPRFFNADTLARYRVVVFANTTGPLLDSSQRVAFEHWLREGGGFLGLHSAADTAYDWPFYGQLVGAWFASHPPGLQRARVRFEHAGTDATLGPWWITDELYNFRRNPRRDVTVIATLTARTDGGGMGDDHPIAWCHDRLGGRAWYTGLGHDAALYRDPVFHALLRSGLRYVLGGDARCDEVSSAPATMAR
ncbi:ThuA domain-containing protein [Luteimonas yindakuii]|uniref:ThuA domain-containing protein n=2 Tax=Luteimonas yindakuii TaxID=2565782 RepID=A0A4Z1RGP3_9GAMM|nr:ThuA domain-containing protein [Luteimonas yindakuii]TKS55343.1 ThuA domain-containing protein [Luteimonas yindakuii]